MYKEVKMEIKEIKIDGCIDIRDNPISIEDFTDDFIAWIESKNWYFGGTTKPFIDDDTTIEEMDFSVFVYNSLKRYGINFKSEIVNMSDDDLLKIRGINNKRLEEIKGKLNYESEI
jgi:hypothetical protein